MMSSLRQGSGGQAPGFFRQLLVVFRKELRDSSRDRRAILAIVIGVLVGPAVIGLILGPLAETQFRRALSISQGDASVFVTHPISATFLGITAALIVLPWILRTLRNR